MWLLRYTFPTLFALDTLFAKLLSWLTITRNCQDYIHFQASTIKAKECWTIKVYYRSPHFQCWATPYWHRLHYLAQHWDRGWPQEFRAVASLTVPSGQEFHFPHFFLKFRSIFLIFPQTLLIFPQTLLIFFLILGLQVGESPTREGSGYNTGGIAFGSKGLG